MTPSLTHGLEHPNLHGADALSDALAASLSGFSGAILVRQAETDLLCRAYGLANRTWSVENRTDTRFRIASVGKLFTAVAVLQLVQAGRLTLATRVPEALDLTGTTIPPEATVFHLLTMTSGIADWCDEYSPTFDADWAQFRREYPLYLFRSDADYLPVFAHRPPSGPVGERHRYNGAGFLLLGLLIERITGMSCFDYVRQHVFTPAGMTATDFLDLDEVAPGVAEGYVPSGSKEGHGCPWRKNIYATTAGPAADGGATSTLEDLARFVLALRTGSLLRPELAQAMTSAQVVQDPENPRGCYGFGCYVLLDGEGETLRWGHTGEEEGVSCRLWFYPKQDITVAVLGNQSACAGKVSLAVQDWILGASRD